MKILIVFLTLIPCLTWAYTKKPLSCSEKGTTIIYINGAIGNPDSMERNIQAIEEVIPKADYDHLDKEAIVKYDHSYNDSRGLFFDLVESQAQAYMSQQGLSRDSAWAKSFSLFTGSTKPAQGFDWGLTEDTFFNAQLIIDLKQLELTDTAKLKTKIFDDYLKQDYKVLIFSHSQGNLFIDVANNELRLNQEYLDRTSVLGNLKVAAPVLRGSTSISKLNYVVNDLDVFLITANSEPANINVPFIPPNFTFPRSIMDLVAHHDLINTYLNYPNLRAFVQQQLIDTAELLESNCQSTNIITPNFTYLQTDEKRISFDASTSTDSTPNPPNHGANDPDFDIVQFYWDFGDGYTGSGMKPSHTYADYGTYYVTLVVTDAAGNSEEITQPVIVSDCLPKFIGCDGQIGQRHTNLNGTCGGFVANTATIIDSPIISASSEICGSSVVAAGVINSKINNSSLTGVSVINSTIQSAVVMGIGNIINSVVNNNLHAYGYEPMFLMGNMRILESQINAPVSASNYMMIEFSTVNKPLSGAIISGGFNEIGVCQIDGTCENVDPR